MEKVTFNDKNLEKAIRDVLGKEHGDITRSNMKLITNLSALWCDISDLTGIEHATNPRRLDLYDNRISDISALSGLTYMEYLNLWSNQITDISSLSDLINLEHLHLGDNQITDISPLSNMTYLRSVSICDNQITDITPLSMLTNLKRVDTDGNPIDKTDTVKERAEKLNDLKGDDQASASNKTKI